MRGLENIWSAVLLALSFCMVASATNRPVDAHNSTIRIHVGKAGLFSAAGHEHWVSAPIDQGSLDDSEPSAHIAFTVQARNLMVEPDKDLSAESRLKCSRRCRRRCLRVRTIPRSAFVQASWRKPQRTHGPSVAF
jgi:hypothetical protein